MAIPRHRGWHLEDFIKQHIHQDANVLDVGGDNAIKIKLILQHKGLKLRRKTGAPTIKVGGELHLFADKSQDLVVLDRVPNIDDEALLKGAARISRKHVLIQTYVEYFGGLESWLERLNPLGQHLVTFLPLHTSDDLATPDNPPVLIVLDVSQAPAEQTEPEERLTNKVKEARLHSQVITSERVATAKPKEGFHRSLKEAAERARANLTDKEREVLDERFRLSGGISEKAESINQRDSERTRLEELFGVTVERTGPGQYLGKTLPRTGSAGASEEGLVQLPIPQVGVKMIRGSGVFKGTLDQFADALGSDSGFEELLSHPQVEFLEEKYFPGAKTGRTQTAVPNGPTGEKGPVARAFQQRLMDIPGVLKLEDALATQMGELQESLSDPEREALSRRFGTVIPPREPEETHLQYGRRVHELIEATMNDKPAPVEPFGRRDTSSDPFLGEEQVHFLPEGEEVTENGRFAGYTTSGWYFFEQDGLSVRGPYSTEVLARAGLQDYLDDET